VQYKFNLYQKPEALRSYSFTHQLVRDGVIFPTDPVASIFAGKFKKHVDLVVGSNANEGLLFWTSQISTETDLKNWLKYYFEGSADSVYDLYRPQNDSPRLTMARIEGDRAYKCPGRTILHAVYDESPSRNLYRYTFDHIPSWIQDTPAALEFFPAATHAQELPFVFGVAADTVGIFPEVSFTPEDLAISSRIMDAWTHFAKHGTMPAYWPQWNPVCEQQVILEPKV